MPKSIEERRIELNGRIENDSFAREPEEESAQRKGEGDQKSLASSEMVFHYVIGVSELRSLRLCCRRLFPR
jgi:hypothetical protein